MEIKVVNGRIELEKEVKKVFVDNMMELVRQSYSSDELVRQSFVDNLELWCQNKASLVELFSKHPNWNPNELCIEMEYEKERPFQRDLVLELLSKFKRMNNINYLSGRNLHIIDAVIRLCDNTTITPEVLARYDFQSDGCMEALNDPTNDLDGYYIEYLVASLIRKFNIREGQKTSKVINKVFTELGLTVGYTNLVALREYDEVASKKLYNKDGSWYLDYLYTYDQWFALVSDLMSPKKFKTNIYISLNPLDYLTQSHGNSWDSCHSLEHKGCYHSSTFTMLTDSTSIIAYTLTNKVEEEYWNERKQTRQSLFINEDKNVIFQNVFYPSRSMEDSAVVRDTLEELICKEKGWDNRWIKSCNSTSKIRLYTEDYLGYHDWDNGKEFMVVVQADYTNQFPLLTIGHNAYAINSDEYISDTDDLRQSKDCDCCGCYASNLTYLPYYDQWVCSTCLEEEYVWCEDCEDWRSKDEAYYCEYTGNYYVEATYVEGYGYVNDDDLYNSGDFFKCKNCGDWCHRDDFNEEEGLCYGCC